MKPLKITFAAVTLLFVSEAKGQGLYFETNTSYNFSIGSQELGWNSESVSNHNYITGEHSNSGSSEQLRGTFGRGLALGLGVGYMFNPTLGFELKAEHQLSSSYTSKSTYSSTTVDFWGNSSDFNTSTNTVTGTMTKIIPSILLQGQGEKIKPYAQAGAIFGFGKIEGSSEEIYNSDIDKSKYVMNGGLAIGINGEVGINYKLSEKLSLNMGLTFSALSYAPAKGELIEYSENGVDMLAGPTVSDREVEFVDELSYNSNTINDPNKPDKSLKMWFPYSNAGLNIGIKFSL